jgi:hypothetical protein
VYRLVLPPPHYTVHVITKSRVFRPNPSLDFKGERRGEGERGAVSYIPRYCSGSDEVSFKKITYVNAVLRIRDSVPF